VRGVRFEGERMVLIPPPRLTGESEEHREITWELARSSIPAAARMVRHDGAVKRAGKTSA
jgi:hypothetical protein